MFKKLGSVSGVGTRHVFIFKIGDSCDAPCFIVCGTYFDSFWGRKDLDMKSKRVKPLVDKLLTAFAREPRPYRSIKYSVGRVVDRVLIKRENKCYNLLPVYIFLPADCIVEVGVKCVDLYDHPLAQFFLAPARKIRNVSSVAA